MRAFLLILAVLPSMSYGQNVYLRSGGPASVIITGATDATPIVLTTQSAHGFASTCGVSTTCYCTAWGVSAGAGITPANGIFQCHYVDSTHLSLYSSASNTAVPSIVNGQGGPWFTGGQGQWVAPVTAYTLGSGPRGWFDGWDGPKMRRLALGSAGGLTAFTVTGGSGSVCTSTPCVMTVTTSYDPTTQPIPVTTSQVFAVHGTGTSLDTCGSGGGADSPYSIASVTSGGWVSGSFTCPGLSTGNYLTINSTCGPTATPNDLRGGTSPCTTLTFMGVNTNPWWTAMLTQQSADNMLTYPNYKTIWDGGSVYPQHYLMQDYAMGAMRFLVDPSSDFFLAQGVYALDHPERESGVNFTQNEGAGVFQSNADTNYTVDVNGLASLYAVYSPYYTAAKKAIFLNKVYNDIDDPSVTTTTKANTDMSNPSNHSWVLATGNIVAGTNDATHVTLASAGHCVVHSIIMLANGNTLNYSQNTYGYVSSCAGAVAAVPGWIKETGATGRTPALDQVLSGTITSVGSLSCTGAAGQWAQLDNGGTYANVYLTGTNTLGTNLVIISPGNGYASPVTSLRGFNAGSATCNGGTATVSTVLGTAYTVFDTVTPSNTAPGATNTVTFTGTASLAGTVNVGDGIIVNTGWGNNFSVNNTESYVSAVGTNTLTVINGPGGMVSGYTMAWRVPAWTTNDVGREWAQSHATVGLPGGNGQIYPPVGGVNQGSGATGIIQEGPNGVGGLYESWPALDMAVGAADSRAVRHLSKVNSYAWDYIIRPSMDYSTGWVHDGSGYSADLDTPTLELLTWSLKNSTYNSSPSFPDTYGAWLSNIATQNMFQTLPLLTTPGTVWIAGWGGAQAGYQLNGTLTPSVSFNPSVGQDPTGLSAKLFHSFADNVNSYAPTPSSFWGATGSLPERRELALIHNDPGIGSTNYRTQPTQYIFNVSSPTLCATLTGWTCNLFRGDTMVSRSGWSANTDTLYYFNSGTLVDGYQSPPITTYLFKAGYLFGAGTGNPPGSGWNSDSSIYADALQFGGAQSETYREFMAGQTGNKSGLIGKAYTTRFAAVNAGSFGPQYGDQSSNYAYVCSDSAAAYNASFLGTVPSFVENCRLHLKKPGLDEFLFEFTDASTSVGTPIKRAIQYNQNGQTFSNPTLTSGSTTCPGSGGCASINTNGRLIKSLESGSGSATYGLLTYITSPRTITVVDDGNGTYSHPFSVSAGTAGSAQTLYTSVLSHKIMQTLSDTTYTTADLNPDANFTGVFAQGSTSAAVYVEARNNTTQSSITAFSVNPTLAHTQYLIAGLSPGAYTPRINGTPVATCNGVAVPCTVAANDNSLYWEDTGTGALTISLSAPSCTITTASLPGGTILVPYSQTISTTGCAAPITWSITAGALCSGLGLGVSTGIISGTPSSALTCSFTVQALDNNSASATQPLSIAIGSPSVGGYILGGKSISNGKIIH